MEDAGKYFFISSRMGSTQIIIICILIVTMIKRNLPKSPLLTLHGSVRSVPTVKSV